MQKTTISLPHGLPVLGLEKLFSDFYWYSVFPQSHILRGALDDQPFVDVQRCFGFFARPRHPPFPPEMQSNGFLRIEYHFS